MLVLLCLFQNLLHWNTLRQKTGLEIALVLPHQVSLGSQWREVSVMPPQISAWPVNWMWRCPFLCCLSREPRSTEGSYQSKVRWVKSHLGLQVPLGSKHHFGALFLSSTSWKVSGAEALSSFRSCCERQPWSFPSRHVPASVLLHSAPQPTAVQALWPWVT